MSSACDNHSKSDEEIKMQLGLSESKWSLVSSVSHFVLLSVQVWPVTLLNWSL